MLIQSVAVCVIAISNAMPFSTLASVLSGAAVGGSYPVLTAITGHYFGRRSFGTILGLNLLPPSILTRVVVTVVGFLLSVAPGQAIIYIAIAALNLAVAFVILRVRPPHSPAEPT